MFLSISCKNGGEGIAYGEIFCFLGFLNYG